MRTEQDERPHVFRSKRAEVGSCTFCNRPHRMVTVIRGAKTLTVEARFCARCVQELKSR